MIKEIQENRLGLVRVCSRCLSRADEAERWRSVLASCVVISVEENTKISTLDFTMCHPFFEPMQPGQDVPEYFVDLDDSGVVTFTPAQELRVDYLSHVLECLDQGLDIGPGGPFHSILRDVVHGRSLITDGKDYGF